MSILTRRHLVFLVMPLLASATGACNPARTRECAALLATMQPLDEKTPTSEAVDAAYKQFSTLAFQDQPLSIFAKNYGPKLENLAHALQLELLGPGFAGCECQSTPPWAADMVKENLEKARIVRDDVRRYCAE